jgi:RNase P subunit RPR2
MRIIERGDLPESKVFQSRCTRCQTLYEFERREAEYRSDQRDGDFLLTHCPTCGRQNFTNC